MQQEEAAGAGPYRHLSIIYKLISKPLHLYPLSAFIIISEKGIPEPDVGGGLFRFPIHLRHWFSRLCHVTQDLTHCTHSLKAFLLPTISCLFIVLIYTYIKRQCLTQASRCSFFSFILFSFFIHSFLSKVHKETGKGRKRGKELYPQEKL